MYITNANLYSILTKITIHKSDIEELFSTFNQLNEILSDKDKERLTAIKYFLSNNNLDKINISGYAEPKKYHNPLLVYGNKDDSPAYHNDANCPLLKGTYRNFFVPKRIQSLGQEEIEKCKKFFPKNKSEMENPTIIKATVIAIQTYYADKYGIHLSENEILVEYKAENSGAINIDTIETPKQILDRNIEEYRNFLEKLTQENTQESHQVYQFRYLLDIEIRSITKNKDNATLNNLSKELLSHKEKLFTSIIEYIKFKQDFNQENINTDFLEKLGFHHCLTCQKKQPTAKQYFKNFPKKPTNTSDDIPF